MSKKYNTISEQIVSNTILQSKINEIDFIQNIGNGLFQINAGDGFSYITGSAGVRQVIESLDKEILKLCKDDTA